MKLDFSSRFDVDKEYEIAAQFCANHDRPWQQSLLYMQLNNRTIEKIFQDETAFTAKIRNIAYSQGIVIDLSDDWDTEPLPQ